MALARPTQAWALVQVILEFGWRVDKHCKMHLVAKTRMRLPIQHDVSVRQLGLSMSSQCIYSFTFVAPKLPQRRSNSKAHLNLRAVSEPCCGSAQGDITPRPCFGPNWSGYLEALHFAVETA